MKWGLISTVAVILAFFAPYAVIRIITGDVYLGIIGTVAFLLGTGVLGDMIVTVVRFLSNVIKGDKK